MKKLIAVVFLLAAFVNGKAQNQTFLKNYQFREGNQYDEIYVSGAVISPMYPGAIFISLEQSDVGESGNAHYALAVLDTNGNLLKTTTYLSNNSAYSNTSHQFFKDNLFIDNNGDIYLSGYKDNVGSWDADGLIMKVDTNNNVWFGKMLGSWDQGTYDDDWGISVAKTLPTSGQLPLYVAGGVDRWANSINDQIIPFISELDKTNGNVKNILK